MDVCRIALAGLYLREDDGPPPMARRQWPTVVGALRRENPPIGQVAAALSRSGLWAEAAFLDEPRRLARAESRVASGSVLTPEDNEYPSRWLSVLGSGAPPALWRSGPLPEGRFVAIVGSRFPCAPAVRFAAACAKEVVRLGFAVASGGAMGCDQAAARGANEQLIEILPCGIDAGAPHPDGGCRLSLAAPSEGFSRGLAMERNALLYAMSDLAIVAEARLREGGSWHGAVDALRRGLTMVAVRDDASSLAHGALAALGARVLSRPRDLKSMLDDPDVQPRLVRERSRAFGLAWSGGAAVL